MTWYPKRVPPSIAILAGLVFACAPGARQTDPTPSTDAPPTPAASTVSADEQARRDASSLEQLLAGRISGVMVSPAPGGGITVRIGGPTSFYSSQDPLFVVDGIAIEAGPHGTLSWLNPHDVESITALKDLSATAIYGARGANGVIVIKTKGSH